MDASPTTAPAPADVLGPAGARAPFRCSDRAVTYTDALDALAVRGGWVPLVSDVSARSTALAAADDATRATVDAGVPGAEIALRRRLRLTSADDYRTWLESWDLDVDDCRDHLRRRALPDPSGDPSPGHVEAVAVRAHVVIEGVLDDAVRRLAEDAALAGADPRSPSWLAEVVERADRVRTEEPDALAVADLVSEHVVDWTRVEATAVVAPDDDVAHELLLCVREEQAPLADVAARVGLSPVHVATFLEALDDWLEPVVLGVEPGALVGPVAHPDGRAVVQLLHRAPPSAADDDVSRRAAAELLERRAAVAMSAVVRWSDGA